MTEIVIRRHQADAARTPSEMSVKITDRRQTATNLKQILRGMQRDRGHGLWSNADPELLVDGRVVGRLRAEEAIEELVDRVLDGALPPTSP